MIYLRSLAVSSIPNSKPAVAALLLALQKMEFLISLSLSGSLLPSGVLTNPSSRYLEEITLDGKLDSTPSDQFILPNLVKLTLSNKSGSGTFTQDFVDKVATLPNLNEMELLDGSYGETKLVFGESGFPSLTKLKLINLVQLETLELLQGSLPELAILTTRGCTKMNILRQRNFFKPRGSSAGKEGLVPLPTSGWEEDVKMELSNRYEKHASVMRDEEEGFGPMMATSRSDGDVWMEQSKRFEEHAAVMRDDDLIVRTLKAKLEAVTQESQEIKHHFAEQINVIKEQNYQLIGNLQDQEETIFQLRELEQQHKCHNALEKSEYQIMKTNFDRMQRKLEEYKKKTLENFGVHEEGCTSKR
ncbi:unnamed protein product [Urochloa humidicola]